MEEINNWNEINGDLNINNGSESHCLNFTSNVRKYARTVRPTIAALGALASFIGIIMIIIAMVKDKKHRTLKLRLVVYLMISTLCVGTMQALSIAPLSEYYEDVYIKGGSSGERACAVIGYFSEMTAWLEHVAIAWITVYIILTVVYPGVTVNKEDKIIKRCEFTGLSFWLLTPIFLCWIPFTTRSYGLSGLWCWIKTTNKNCSEVYTSGLVYQFLFYYVPFLALVLFNIVTFVIIFFHYCIGYYKYEHKESSRKALKIVGPFCLYPIVYDVLFAIAFANRISYAVAVTHAGGPNHDLWILHSFAESGRSLYPPFIFLVVSIISYFNGKCTNSRPRTITHVRFETTDEHASHPRSSITNKHSPSETFYHVSQEFINSDEEHTISSHVEESEIHVQYYGSFTNQRDT